MQTTVYIIMKCKLDGEVKTEVEFCPENVSSVRVLAEMENEYTISVKAPSKLDWNFPPPFSVASFLSLCPCPEKWQRDKSEGCNTG